jgi:hypothetical protein
VRAPAALVAAALLGGCTTFVRYTGELTDSRSGRTLFVTAPATFGGFLGFLAGLPVDIVALPVTFLVYEMQKSQGVVEPDPLSTMLFPSFVLWRTGTLIAVPFDAIEFSIWRNWQPPPSMTASERAALEYELDQQTLPRYPVEPVHPIRDPGVRPDR